ncbi:MAG: adenylyl-sulfate kinase, partial [Candidatus Nanopelagicales bacterium]
ARDIYGDGEFLEVYVDTPVEMCAERDPKGLYAKAKAGTLPNMTGLGQEYEPPESPDVHLDGTASIEDNVDILVQRLSGD